MYFSHLDTMRWYAVAMVMFSHIFQVWTWDRSTAALFPLGRLGVVIFFVLSGFLITLLLLKEPENKCIKLCFKEFYIRRSLRIFPIYYIFLSLMYVGNIADVNNYGMSPWLYLTNLYIFTKNEWIGPYSHLWTLAVEEQFYLIWPFLILFIRSRKKILFISFICIITVSIGTRFFLLTNGYSTTQTAVFPLASIDFFAIGALISLGKIKFDDKLRYFGYPLLLAGILIYYGIYALFDSIVFVVIGKFAMGLVAAGIIIVALNSSVKNNLFHNRFTIRLGKISYGIYLYHNVIIYYYADIAGFFGLAVGSSIYIKIVTSIFFTLIISELSFRLIEKPILEYKNRFRTV